VYKLALTFGVVDPDWFYKNIPARIIGQWEAYYQIDPWGDERADLRNGILASTMVNCNPFRKKSARSAKPTDFMPFREKVKQTWQQIKGIFQALAGSKNNADNRKT
jgi:hypothetical protein